MENFDAIKSRCNLIGINFDEVKDFLRVYLIRIEYIADKKREEFNEALKILKEESISISSMAKEMKCSRTTLYNNPILKSYIISLENDLRQDNPFILCDALRNKIADLEKEIGLLFDRDIDYELLKRDIKVLKEDIADKNDQIKRLHSRVGELSAQNEKMKSKVTLMDNRGSLIKFDNNSKK